MRLRSGLSAIALATLVVLGSTSAAYADCHDGPDSGSGYVFVGPSPAEFGDSNGYASWNKSTKSFTIQANAWGMSSNYCETTWIDWAVSSGHFDARAVRLCDRTNSQKAASFTETASVTFTGLQKFGACYGPTNTMSGCRESTLGLPCTLGTQDANFGSGYSNWITRYWVRDANGTSRVGSGGVPTSATS